MNLIIKKITFRELSLILLLGLFLISCSGVHNEPPSEIVRTSGAGPSTGSGTTSLVGGGEATSSPETGAEGEATDQTISPSRAIILDSSGNPIKGK